MTQTEKQIREQIDEWFFDESAPSCLYGPPVEEVIRPRKRKKNMKS